MSIAIVISTHGSAAEQLLVSLEMILGKQENISCINFIPGENTDILVKKYNNCLSDLNVLEGVIFMVDTWGGSPFNAASQIIINKENHEVITGVNIPMLIETLMARDDSPTFWKLVSIAIKSGKTGIKSLKNSSISEKIISSSEINS